MARANQRDPQAEQVQAYLEGVAKNLIDKLYGTDGPPWGTSLTQIEDLILDIRQRLTKAMVEQALTRQAATHDLQALAYRTCPGCQQPIACDDTNPRIVQTRTGEAEWSEPQAYCPRCRRAFFPSVEEPGHWPGGTQPGAAPEDHLRGNGEPFVHRGPRAARGTG